ncbi:MAG: CPBP family intramembrane metalloprotease [Chloroflexaceae bacterium]|nr:CPBP family intramembrane metalloprotease [Chloroflexaceae bacterium]
MQNLLNNAPDPDMPPVTWGWRDVIAVVVTVLAGTLVLLGAIQLLPIAQDEALGVTSPVPYISTALIYLLILLAVYLFAARRSGWAALGWRPVPIPMLLMVPALLLLIITGMVLINLLIVLATGDFENPQVDALTGGNALTSNQLLLLLVLVAGVVPAVEEVFFRGMIYGLMRRQWGALLAIVASAALFSVVHVLPILMPALFFVGLVLGFLREWSKSIVPCILLHSLQNALVLIAINATLSGM